MKPETLTALSIDHALGAMPPDVAELFSSYLAHDPAAEATAAEWRETCRVARRATRAVPLNPANLPPPAFIRRPATPRTPALRAEIIRLAACLAVGLGLGWIARAPRSDDVRSIQVASVAAPTASSVFTPASSSFPPAARFWSVARFATASSPLTPRRAMSSTPSLPWTAPAPKPLSEAKP